MVINKKFANEGNGEEDVFRKCHERSSKKNEGIKGYALWI